MAIKPVSVSQLGQYVKQIFDAEELLHGISVFGEISGWTNSRGVVYFTLKDADASMSCVLFSSEYDGKFNDGDCVMVVGTPRYYVKGGKLNFNVFKIESYGESVLYKQFLELKQQLLDMGYFEESRKKPIPKEIKRIGVVSSESGAVIQDIINVRTRRNPAIDIVLYPVKVQGDGAEFEIAQGIYFLDNYNVDAIIVARGGGSVEDLQPFNTKVVADAVYNANKFVLSAVGHETDFTIIDFCSDLRAPTPSAGAELLCSDLKERARLVNRLSSILQTTFLSYMDKSRVYLKQKIVDLNRLYNQSYENIFKKFDYNVRTMLQLSDVYFEKKFLNCEKLIGVLDKLNPNEILKLGYSCVKNNNDYISSVHSVNVGCKIEVKMHDGIIVSEVLEVKNGL